MKNEIKLITNQHKDFYKIMGPIFGSRAIEKITGDRFYDDDEKIWYLHFNSEGKVDVYISLKKNIIKNVFAFESDILVEVLVSITTDISKSVIPVIYENAFVLAGYTVVERKKRFVAVVKGDAHEI